MKKDKSNHDLEPQKSSAAQFLTYIASTGTNSEKYEIRYEDENIWMSQKMLAQVYGVEVPNIAYHLRKLYEDAELDKASTIKEILIVADNGKNYRVNHYNLQVIIALGFKIDNERAVQFRKWANRIVGDYTIRGYVMDKERFKNGTPLSNEYFEHLLEDIREIRLSERKFYQKVTDLYAGPITLEQVENVTAAIAQAHAESEFEKYRVLQDRLFMSDYDRYLLELEEEVKKGNGAFDDAE